MNENLIIKNEEILEKISKLEETTISSLNLSDLNWEIVKQYKKESPSNLGKYLYYLLLRCKRCGELKLIAKNSYRQSNIECPNCVALSYIGKIYGCYKVLEFDHIEHISGRYKKFYKVECTHCHKTYIKELNTTQWSKYSKCRYCSTCPEKPEISLLYSQYKTSAKMREIEWNLDFDAFYNLVLAPCCYCGTYPKTRYIKKKKNSLTKMTANGVDRIDSSKGYSIDNCVPCCTMCNSMKLDYSLLDFETQIMKIYNHLNLGSETIENTSNDGSELSTSQANGDGNGGHFIENEDIVQSTL